jgi:hypothetical protein
MLHLQPYGSLQALRRDSRRLQQEFLQATARGRVRLFKGGQELLA